MTPVGEVQSQPYRAGGAERNGGSIIESEAKATLAKVEISPLRSLAVTVRRQSQSSHSATRAPCRVRLITRRR
jgi:hypothetical protein